MCEEQKPSAEMLGFIGNVKKLAERLPDKYVGKQWFLEYLEMFRCAAAVAQAASEFRQLGETVVARLERDAQAGKMQLLLAATRQLQKVLKKFTEADAPKESPVQGLSMQDLLGAESSEGMQKLTQVPELTEAVQAQGKILQTDIETGVESPTAPMFRVPLTV